jgi:cytochrome bd-type quinol oxidase subunit 1
MSIKQVSTVFLIVVCIILAVTVAVHAKTMTPPSKPEFSAYEATFEKGDSGIKKVVVLQDNKHDQEFVLVPGYGTQFRWQDSRKIEE